MITYSNHNVKDDVIPDNCQVATPCCVENFVQLYFSGSGFFLRSNFLV